MTGPWRDAPAATRRFPHLIVWGGMLVAGILVGVMAFHALSPVEVEGEGLVQVEAITHEHAQNHVHGIGYNEAEDGLFIATHFGLFLMKDATGEDPELYQVGDLRWDFMGFNVDPADGHRLYASGHPEPGRNLGVVRSTDGGSSWQEVWDGPEGRPVDLHVMALSAVEPGRLAGFDAAGDRLLLRLAPKESWLVVDPPVSGGVASLAWDGGEADRLWTGTAQGLYTSVDPGGSWELVRDGVHPAVYAHPADDRLWAWEHERGLFASTDAGADWARRGDGSLVEQKAPVFALSGGPQDGDVLFAALVDGQVWRTLDGGVEWQRVHPLG